MTKKISNLFTESLTNSGLTAKQRDVLQASLTLFSEKGFENTSTKDIAKLAGVGEGTVYKQFKTKKELLEAVITPTIEEVVPKAVAEFVDEMMQEKELSFKTFLQKGVKNRLEFVRDNLPQLRIFIREIIVNQELLNQITEEFVTLLNGQLKDRIKFYQQQGQLAQVSLAQLAKDVVGVMLSYILPMVLFPEMEYDVDQASAEIAEFLYKGLAPTNKKQVTV